MRRTVLYDFVGFSQLVDINGVLNIAKAGQTIPLKFRLLDASGNPVTNLDPAKVKVIAVSLACSAGMYTDQIDEYAAGVSGLQNLGNGYYQWNWKTLTSFANTCKTLKLDLGEGTGFEHTVLFQFKKQRRKLRIRVVKARRCKTLVSVPSRHASLILPPSELTN